VQVYLFIARGEEVALHKSVDVRNCTLFTDLEHTAIQILHTSRMLLEFPVNFLFQKFHVTDGSKKETECLVSLSRNINNGITF